MNQTYYYTAREVSGGWIGIVYFYDNYKERHAFVSERVPTEEKAKSLAYAEWQKWNQPQGIIKQ